jgi:hypothetical protein
MITIVSIGAFCVLSVLLQMAYISLDRKKNNGMTSWEEQAQTPAETEDTQTYPYLLVEAMEIVRSKSSNRLN